jgi:hypothetical protein
MQDNAYPLGAGSERWSAVHAVNGTIITSDEKEKQDIRTLDVAEQNVAVALKGLVRAYRRIDEVAKDAAGAKIHVGVIAQQVEAAFAAQGLEARNYAMFHEEEIEEYTQPVIENGTVVSGDTWAKTGVMRYGVRYDELLAFIIGAL